MIVDPVNRTVYVSRMAKTVTNEILHELFLQAGPVESVVMQNDFAFVIFEDSESVPYACSLLNETPLFGVPLLVKPRTGSVYAVHPIPVATPNQESMRMAAQVRRRQEDSMHQMFVLEQQRQLQFQQQQFQQQQFQQLQFQQQQFQQQQFQHLQCQQVQMRQNPNQMYFQPVYNMNQMMGMPPYSQQSMMPGQYPPYWPL